MTMKQQIRLAKPPEVPLEQPDDDASSDYRDQIIEAASAVIRQLRAENAELRRLLEASNSQNEPTLPSPVQETRDEV